MHAPLSLGAGSSDPMVTREDMLAFDPDPDIFDGVGHNVHVERADLIWRMIERIS